MEQNYISPEITTLSAGNQPGDEVAVKSIWAWQETLALAYAYAIALVIVTQIDITP